MDKETGGDVSVRMNAFIDLEGGFPLKAVIGATLLHCGDGALLNAL